MRFEIENVDLMPSVLRPGILYYSDDFEIAIHLCACGCGTKITTPIGPTEWNITETPAGPTLYPSIGNWQLACKSHYFIRGGGIVWAPSWSNDEILSGRADEARRRATHYNKIQPRQSWIERVWNTIVQKVGEWFQK